MDSFELSKIAAGVLTALLVVFGVKTTIAINSGAHGGGHAENHSGYVLAAAAPAAKSGGAPAAPAAGGFDAAKVAAAVATGKAAAGQEVFKKCSACHTTENGGAAKAGPNLFGIVGRAKAAAAGFGYSDDMKAKGGKWELADLATFLNKPKDYVPKTKMAFGGIADTGDLANLLAYLSTLK